MAEPFRIAAGAIGIATAFTACIDCFEYINLAGTLDETITLLNLLSAVQGKADATATEIQLAKNTMLQILVLFADTESISKYYKMTAKPGDDMSAFSLGDMDPTLMMLENKMRGLAISRQKESPFLKLSRWALYHKSELKDLLEQINSLVNNLEELFPARQARTILVRQEMAEFSDKNSRELMQNVAKGVDSLLQTALQEVLTGHQYSKIVVNGQAQIGDAYGSDWAKGTVGASHGYNAVEIDRDGKALIGNKYGGKDFWDVSAHRQDLQSSATIGYFPSSDLLVLID